MANEIRETIRTNIGCKGQFGDDQQMDGHDQQSVNTHFKISSLLI